MPAAERLVPLSDIDTDIDTDLNTNRYSMFDQLDNIALSSPELSLAPSSFSSKNRRVDDETIRRLSTSLQQLVCQKHGNHQLPELPIPTYDNGNIDLTSVTAAVEPSPAPVSVAVAAVPDVAAQSNPAIVVSTSQTRPRSISDISSDLDDAFDTRLFTQSTHLLAHVDSPVHTLSQYASRSSSLPRSRPVSMYGTTFAPRVRSHQRPDTSGSQSTRSRLHKKATSYSEQRYSPTRQQDSSYQENLFIQPNQPNQPKNQAQRRFRLIPSFKNLNAQNKSHAKKLAIEEEPVTHVRPKAEPAQLIDIHAALRGLSPLHDPDHDQKFTLECQEMLHPKPDSRQQQSRKMSIPKSDFISQDSDHTSIPAFAPIFRHTSNVSEAPTIDTNILNWDWPQPPTTHAPMPTEKDQQQHRAALTLQTGLEPLPQNENCKYTMAPSPPPTYPLPPVPSAAGSPTKQSSKKSLVNPITSANIGLSFKKYNFSTANKASTKTNNRINTLAADRGLSLDAGLSQDASNAGEMAGGPTAPLPSPLNARFNQSSRNSRVREVKKKHVSDYIKDIPAIDEVQDKPQNQAELGQGSSEAPISIYSSTKASISRKLTLTDQRKPLPQIPVTARYRASGESFAGVTKANIGKSRHARDTSARSRRSSRQINDAEESSSLAPSGVMVMVDSSPRQSRDFRAGAFRPSGAPRRRVSIGKAQTQPPLRYQPSPKRRIQPRKLSSPPVIDQKRSDSSSIVSKIEVGPHQISTDLAMTFIDCESSSGAQSPSKASSILEPSPFNASSCSQDGRQSQALSERSPTPVRHVKDRQYVPIENVVSVPCTPPTRQDQSISNCSTSRRRKIEHLHNEINRMVRGHHGAEPRKDIGPGSRLAPAQKLRGDCKSESRAQASSKTSPSSRSTDETLARIEADLVEPTWPDSSFPTPSRRVARNRSTMQHEDSDMSITPKSSFQSTSSESSKNQRKNSDASMTDPNDYDGAPCPPKSSYRLVIMPTPPRQKPVDTTGMRSKKRYSNMPAWTTHSKASDVNDVSLETPYTFRKHEQRSLFPQRRVVSNADASTACSSPDPDVEVNHFLTEAGQMDSAIDSFVESTSSNGSCRSRSDSRSRSRLPMPTSSPYSSGNNTTPQRQIQLQTQLHHMLSASKDQQRHSAMSNISTIVDLQRIQDQINSGATEQKRYQYVYGACRDAEGFGRISLVARPSTT